MAKKILLFGGSFDPPHLGHELVIHNALSQLEPDELWVMPCWEHAFGKKMTRAKQRLAMCRLLVSGIGDKRVIVSTLEIDEQLFGSTYETLKLLHSPRFNIPDTKYDFLIGSDQLAGFHRWREYKKLLKEMTFYVYPRAGFKVEPWYEEMRLIEGGEVSWVSSTQVRKKIAKDEGIGDLVPERIAEYIFSNGLYRWEAGFWSWNDQLKE